MRTTVLNPTNPRRKRRAKKSYRRRRNVEANPRRRRRVYRRSYRRNPVVNARRRSYSRRRNPASNPDLNLSRIAYATGGGVLARFGMRKLGGKRVTEGGERKLDMMHYVAALGSIYFGPDVAEAIGATPDEARAFADGAAAVAGQFIVDQHLRDFSASNLMPFDSPTPTGTDLAGIGRSSGIGGLGASKSNPLPYKQYMQLAGIGQLPPGGVYVRGADGSVWWFPGRNGARTPALAGGGLGFSGCTIGAGNGKVRELPDYIAVGALVRDTETGERFVVAREGNQRVLIPQSHGGMGANQGDYFGLVSAR